MRLPEPVRRAWHALGNVSTLLWLWGIGGAAVIGFLTWIAGQPLWLVLYVSLGVFAILVILAPYAINLWHKLFGSKLIAVSVSKSVDVPESGMTAVELVIRNQRENLKGLLAVLTRTEPPLNGFPTNINLPLSLATKTRWAAYRAGHEPRPNQRFDLDSGAEKSIEIFWLGTSGALEATISHQAHESEFLTYHGYIFHIEITGADRPFRFSVRLFLTNEETSAWDCELLP